jgi:hypothetical protein
MATFMGGKVMGVVLAFILGAVTAAPNTGEAAWRQTGKFPLIAGVWREAPANVDHGPIFVTVAQHGGKFQAECNYQFYPNKERRAVEVQWRMDGTIAEDGEITGILVATAAPEGWALRQKRTGRLDVEGQTIQGHASWNDGGHDFTWNLKEPLEAEKLFVVKFYTPDKKGRNDHTVEIIAPTVSAAKEKVRKDHSRAAIQHIEEK